MSEATKNSPSPDADDERRAVADGDDLLGLVGRDQRPARRCRARAPARLRAATSSEPAPFFSSRATRCATISVSVSVWNLWPSAIELVLQLEVVLDDAVVDDDDAAGAVAVRVRVLLGRPAVRGPARVADAVVAGERRRLQDVFEARQLAGARRTSMPSGADHGHARRVVAAVLEPPQPLDEDGHDLLLTDVADDAAHAC